MTLAGYRFARRFKIGILVTKEYCPCCGVAPGCGNAAFMVMLHQIGPLDKLVLRLAPLSVRLQVYYDDMGMDADRAQEGALLETMDAAADARANTVEGDLGCRLAVKKGGLSSNSETVSNKLSRGLGDLPQPNAQGTQDTGH